MYRRRWMAVGLVASLAVNAFFIGAAATDVLHSPTIPDRGTSLLRYEVRWLRELLPQDAMAEIETAFASGRPTVEMHLERLRELRTELGVLIAQPIPDRAAVDAQLVSIRAEIDDMLEETQTLTTAALLALPSGTRAALGVPH